MNLRSICSLACGALLGCCAFAEAAAQEAAPLAGYAPGEKVSGTIRVWGDDYMSAVVRNWAEGFSKFQPEVKFEVQLMGSSIATHGLYLGTADLALMGREPNTTDSDSYLHVRQYRPLRLELMNGSLDVPGKSYALVAFVHKNNPLSKLTLTQLNAIFGCAPGRSVDNIRSWGQLGLTGAWKNRPINLYGYDAETGTGVFFQHAALNDSRQMNWERLKEFRDIRNPDGSTYESGQQIIDALRADPYGLAISNLRYQDADVKPLALAAREGQPFYEATRENLIARRYPLMRRTYAFVNKPPGTTLDPKMREFLRYVLSREGQQDVVREGGYLPLSAETVDEQLKALN